MDTAQEAHVLFLVRDREPVFDEVDSRAHQHAFEIRHRAEELLVFLGSTKAHHVLDARPVVPAAIETDDFPSRRQMRRVTLEIPLRALAVIGGRQRHHAADARIESLRDALDRAALACGIATLEQDHDLLARRNHPVLQLHQFGLQPEQLREIPPPVGELSAIGRRGGDARRQVLAILDLHFQLFVVAVGQVAAETTDEVLPVERGQIRHRAILR